MAMPLLVILYQTPTIDGVRYVLGVPVMTVLGVENAVLPFVNVQPVIT
jgi:hypothetical protein